MLPLNTEILYGIH